jgi:hypothetical protein
MKPARLASCAGVRVVVAGMMLKGACFLGSVICAISHWLDRPRAPSWDRSGPNTPPVPAILWHTAQPAEANNGLPSDTLLADDAAVVLGASAVLAPPGASGAGLADPGTT